MEQSKPPNDDLEHLLALAKSEGTPEENRELTEAERFVISIGIKSGGTKIRSYHIWLKYLQWTKQPIKQQVFYKQFAKIFPVVKTKYCWVYHLDPSSFDLSLENTFRIYSEIRKERLERKEEWKRKRKVQKDGEPSTQD
jgi:hypothetical protein